MPSVPISQLPPVSEVSPSAYVPLDQNGVTSRATVQQIGAAAQALDQSFLTVGSESGTLPNSRAAGATNGITKTDSGAGGTLTFSLTGQALAFHLLSTTGLTALTGGGSVVTRSLAGPGKGFTISNADGVAGNPTFALTGGLLALEDLTGPGVVCSTGTDTFSPRTLTGTANQIDIANPQGAGGDPTFAIADDPRLPGTGGFLPPGGTTAQRPLSPPVGFTRRNTDLNVNEAWDGAQWVSQGVAGVTSVGATGQSGITVTGSPITSAGTFTISLDDTPVTPGTYGSDSQVGTFTVDQQGRLTAASNTTITPAAIGAIATDGDASLATVTPTGGSVAATLAAWLADGGWTIPSSLSGSDISAALAAAYAALPSSGGAIVLPPGRFRLASSVSLAEKPVALIGAGRGLTTLACEMSGTALTITQTSMFSHTIVQGLDFEAARSAGPCARALDIVYPDGVTSFAYSSVLVEDVGIITNTGTTGPTWANSWTAGIRLTNCWYPRIQDVDIFLTPDLGVASGSPQIEFAGGDYACIAPHFDNVVGYYGSEAVLCSGYTEGLITTKCEFVGVTRGISVPSTTPVGGFGGAYRAQALWLLGTHIAAWESAIAADKVQDIELTGVNIQRSAGSTAAAWSGLLLNDCYAFDITGGVIAGNSGTGTATGISATGTTGRGRVSTTFENLDTQFSFGASTSGIDVIGCTASGANRDTWTNSGANYIQWRNAAGQYQFNGGSTFSSSVGFTFYPGDSRLAIAHPTSPTLDFFASSVSTDNKRWRFGNFGGANFYMQAINDAYSAAASVFEVGRTDLTIDYFDVKTQVRCNGYAFATASALVLKSYTVATLPSAATPGQQIYVSDGTSDKHLAVSDGTNWRWPDGAIVS